MKTLGDAVLPNNVASQHVQCCPKCSTGTESIYDDTIFLGSGCRECLLLWNCTNLEGYYTITGEPYTPKEKKRTYEIVVTHTSHYIKAANAEEAKQKLIKKLRFKEDYECYGVLDHAECNEGIC